MEMGCNEDDGAAPPTLDGADPHLARRGSTTGGCAAPLFRGQLLMRGGWDV